ncbi:MAG: metallophosphatase family protein, partial [Methanothrix sp.]|nr:metallophosphatase family protein [Methanothrix sp.]
MRIIALSDTHLNDGVVPLPLEALLKKADIILHAGDFVSASAYATLSHLGRLEAVRGNSDCSELKR